MRRGASLALLPFLLFTVTLLATVMAAVVTRQAFEEAARARLEQLADNATERLMDRLQIASGIARGTAGLFSAEEQVSAQAFHAFVGSQSVTRWFPHGRVFWVEAEEAPELRPAEPRYHVRLVWPKSEANERVLRLDLGLSERRRDAIERARDEGDTVLISDFTLEPGWPSAAVLAPAYAGAPLTLDERRAQFRGVVIVSAATDDLLATFTSDASAYVELEDLTEGRLLWSAPDFPARAAGTRREVLFEGRELAVHLVPREVENELQRFAFVAILVVGTLLAFAFAGLTFQQLHARQAAELAQRESRAAFDEADRRRAEQERLIVALEFSNAELEQFASVASHDLKAPLRGISQLAQWLEEDLGTKLSPEDRQHLALLKGRVRRLLGLIDGILGYARAGQSSMVIERFDARDAVADALALLAPPPGSEVLLPAPGLVLEGDKALLVQVLMNLLSNAFTHGSTNGAKVEVRVEPEGDFVRFGVRDEGPGIAPEYHQRIWGMFQTLVPRDEKESTGIGLAVVRKVVQAQGGRVWLESARGAGATFFFTWPRRPRPAQ